MTTVVAQAMTLKDARLTIFAHQFFLVDQQQHEDQAQTAAQHHSAPATRTRYSPAEGPDQHHGPLRPRIRNV